VLRLSKVTLTRSKEQKMRLKLTPNRLLLEFDSLPVEADETHSPLTSEPTSPVLEPITHRPPVRHVHLQREKYGGFGFAVRALPVTFNSESVPVSIVCAISSNSPADRCRSLFIGDRLLTVQGQSVQEMNHEQIVRTLKQAGPTLTLSVQSNSIVVRPPTSGRWRAPSKSASCWCEPCTARHEHLEEAAAAAKQALESSTSSCRTPSNCRSADLRHPTSESKSRSRFASPLRPFVRASTAYSSMIVTPSSARRGDGKENTPKIVNSAQTVQSTKQTQPSRRSVRFRSLWRSACTSKQAAGSETSSAESSPTNPNAQRSRSVERIDLSKHLHQLSTLNRDRDQNVRSFRTDSPNDCRSITTTASSTERRLLSPLRAGAQPTCRTIRLLHCQLTKFISCTDNVRRTSFELRWPNSESPRTADSPLDCGSFCSALIHCADSNSAAELYDAFDTYIRLLRQQAVAGLNASLTPNPKQAHLFTWATVCSLPANHSSNSIGSNAAGKSTSGPIQNTIKRSPNHSLFGPWSPMYVLIRGGQMQLWQQTPDSIRYDLSSLALSEPSIESSLSAHFETLGRLMSSSAVRCTFTCCCCADPDSPVASSGTNSVHSNQDTVRRSRRMRSTSSTLADCATLAGHHSPDSTLGCSIGSSLSSSLALHQPITPPPPVTSSSGAAQSRADPLTKTLSGSGHAPLHVLNACSTFVRRMRTDELPDRRTHCVQVQCAQPHLQFCLAFENDQQVIDLLDAWSSATSSSVQQLSVSVRITFLLRHTFERHSARSIETGLMPI
jgi:hypothetical protein